MIFVQDGKGAISTACKLDAMCKGTIRVRSENKLEWVNAILRDSRLFLQDSAGDLWKATKTGALLLKQARFGVEGSYSAIIIFKHCVWHIAGKYKVCIRFDNPKMKIREGSQIYLCRSFLAILESKRDWIYVTFPSTNLLGLFTCVKGIQAENLIDYIDSSGVPRDMSKPYDLYIYDSNECRGDDICATVCATLGQKGCTIVMYNSNYQFVEMCKPREVAKRQIAYVFEKSKTVFYQAERVLENSELVATL